MSSYIAHFSHIGIVAFSAALNEIRLFCGTKQTLSLFIFAMSDSSSFPYCIVSAFVIPGSLFFPLMPSSISTSLSSAPLLCILCLLVVSSSVYSLPSLHFVFIIFHVFFIPFLLSGLFVFAFFFDLRSYICSPFFRFCWYPRRFYFSGFLFVSEALEMNYWTEWPLAVQLLFGCDALVFLWLHIGFLIASALVRLGISACVCVCLESNSVCILMFLY